LPTWIVNLPFIGIHVACLAVFLVGVHPLDLVLCAACYLLRMVGITAGYHRYFAHRSFKTSRPAQFLLGMLGCSALQKGPLWWSAHHRHHHLYSDTVDDPHSPVLRSIWWAHVGWVLASDYESTDASVVRDWNRFPELRWLDRLHWLPGIMLGVACWLIGGWSGLIWGLFVSTTLLYHGVFTVNSLCHLAGKRRFSTGDQSRNNWFVALITLGEGWHNNHHHYQSSANQGFYWWEIDICYYLIQFFGVFGLVWDIRRPPRKVLSRDRCDSRESAQTATTPTSVPVAEALATALSEPVLTTS
jgi:stearoyl-CoA desaturase (delta-9 desaturase)